MDRKRWGQVSSLKAMGVIRYNIGRFDMLVGVMSLALAMVLANLYARKRSAARDLALMTRTTSVLGCWTRDNVVPT